MIKKFKLVFLTALELKTTGTKSNHYYATARTVSSSHARVPFQLDPEEAEEDHDQNFPAKQYLFIKKLPMRHRVYGQLGGHANFSQDQTKKYGQSFRFRPFSRHFSFFFNFVGWPKTHQTLPRLTFERFNLCLVSLARQTKTNEVLFRSKK